MKILKIVIVMLILITSVGAVCAADAVSGDDAGYDNQKILQSVQEDNILETTQDDVYSEGEASFFDLQMEIVNATDVLQITKDYKFNNESDASNNGIGIVKDNFVIEGNGHTIDGNNQSRIFIVHGTNVTIKNLTFVNANIGIGSAIYVDPDSSLKTDSVIFENNTATNGVVFVTGSEYCSFNDQFKDSTSTATGVILVQSGSLYVENALMSSSKELSWGFIHTNNRSPITVLNSVFRDAVSKYSTAIMAGGNTTVRNSKFINLESVFTAGAIGVKQVNELIVDNCSFVNVISDKNGGAIFADVVGGVASNTGEVLINRSTFVNCSSGFGGALLQLGGLLKVANSNFINDTAIFDGGAIYVSHAEVSVINSTFNGNSAWYPGEERGSFGGAIFFDMGMLSLKNSNLTQNSAQYGGAIYLYDSSYNISGTAFKENKAIKGEFADVCTFFDGDIAVLDNATNTYTSNDSLSINNTDYATISVHEGMNLSLIKNSIDVSTLPSRFDLRDWGWLTSVKNQGNMGACWTFGSSGAMESAILRYLGIVVDLSENNMQDVSLKYFKFGISDALEGAVIFVPAQYALSWFGVFNEDYDEYDQLGKISPIFAVPNSIHFQDAVMLPPLNSATDNDHYKKAILQYGGLFINYYAVSQGVEQYYNGTPTINHGVTLIGWDDNRQIAGAPGKGAWIIKNSWGEGIGENGFQYISYYDTAFSAVSPAYAFVFENTVVYNKNYQYDIEGKLNSYNNATEYRNNYEALADDLIAGVGTYFMDAGVAYNIEIYVNDELRLTQDGVSPFMGFHTIKLDSYVPIKEGDFFTVKIKSDSVPVLEKSRQHYMDGASQYLYDGVWMNISAEHSVCSIKAYTVADDTKIINNGDISVDYDGGKFFSVKVVTDDGHAVGAGEVVKFTINKKTTPVTTDANGVASLKITDVPGKYTLTTQYNGKTYTNKVTVKQVLTASKVTVKNTAKKFTLKATLKINGKAVKGKWVTFKFNGKTYKAKTNAKGVAQKTLDKKVINKLKKGKTYTVKVTYLKDTIKTTVKVK